LQKTLPASDDTQTQTENLSALQAIDGRLPAAIKIIIAQADAHINAKQWPKAIAVLERALRINPRQAETWSRMAWVYLFKNEFEQAIHMAKRANGYALQNPKLQAYNQRLIASAYLNLEKSAEHRN
jgi:tetratricopeptide (TPR) repeat protein